MPAFLRQHDKGLEYSLEDYNLLGRSPDATIRLNDAGISRQHATIRRDGNLYWVSDLGSANGSFVNDVAVTTARALRHGDSIQLGTCLFIFENEEGDSSSGSHSGTQMLHTVALPMKTVRATLLVGDLRNFTSISAQLSPEEVAEMLREWYAQCTTVLKTRGAIIDKFIGDGVFAYWTGDGAEVRAQATEAARLLSSPESSDSPVRRRLKTEMNRSESEMSCDRHFVGGICTNADGSIRKEEGMALGGAERCHGSGEYYKSKGKLRFSKGQFR